MEDIPGEKFREYFQEKLPGKMTDEELLDLIFLVAGRKPGALVMEVDNSTVELLKDFCQDFGLEIKVVEGGERSIIDRLLGRDTRFFKDSVFLTTDRTRFEILESSDGKFCGFTDEAVGEFLGYPPESIDYYAQKDRDKPAGMENEEKIGKLQEKGVLTEEDIDYLDLISFLPEPEKESLLEAVEEGKDRAELLEKLDSEMGTCLRERFQD